MLHIFLLLETPFYFAIDMCKGGSTPTLLFKLDMVSFSLWKISSIEHKNRLYKGLVKD